MRIAALVIAVMLPLAGPGAAGDCTPAAPGERTAPSGVPRTARMGAFPLLSGSEATASAPARTPWLRPCDVTAKLKARGFVDVSEVRQRGRTFLAEATGPRGERVRLVVDAASGEISGMQVIGFEAPR